MGKGCGSCKGSNWRASAGCLAASKARNRPGRGAIVKRGCRRGRGRRGGGLVNLLKRYRAPDCQNSDKLDAQYDQEDAGQVTRYSLCLASAFLVKASLVACEKAERMVSGNQSGIMLPMIAHSIALAVPAADGGKKPGRGLTPWQKGA